LKEWNLNNLDCIRR